MLKLDPGALNCIPENLTKKSNISGNDKLKILVIDFQSILNKKPDLLTLIGTERPDILAGTEMLLTPDVTNITKLYCLNSVITYIGRIDLIAMEGYS